MLPDNFNYFEELGVLDIMKLSFLITIVPFVFFSASVILIFFLMKKILSLVKKNEPEKWEFMMSSSNSFWNDLIGEDSAIWVNSRRFDKFIRNGDYFGDSSLERCVRLYRICKIAAFSSWIVCVLSFFLIAIVEGQ